MRRVRDEAGRGQGNPPGVIGGEPAFEGLPALAQVVAGELHVVVRRVLGANEADEAASAEDEGRLDEALPGEGLRLAPRLAAVRRPREPQALRLRQRASAVMPKDGQALARHGGHIAEHGAGLVAVERRGVRRLPGAAAVRGAPAVHGVGGVRAIGHREQRDGAVLGHAERHVASGGVLALGGEALEDVRRAEGLAAIGGMRHGRTAFAVVAVKAAGDEGDDERAVLRAHNLGPRMVRQPGVGGRGNDHARLAVITRQ